MKRILPFILALVCTTFVQSKVEDGKTYRIAVNSDNNKSLFVQNASLDENANVVIWTETDVPAQQWTATFNDAGRVAFRNVYTGMYLNIVSSKLVQVSNVIYLPFDVVNAEENLYMIRQMGKYLTANDPKDGAMPTMTATKQPWHFIEVEAQSTFNTAMRDRMAKAFLKQYRQAKGAMKYTFTNGGWSESETMEAVLDMYEADKVYNYKYTYTGCYDWFREHVGGEWNSGTIAGGYDWFGYDFNDDVMWQIIGAARAYNLLGTKQYLNDAKHNFKLIYDRAYMPYCGLMRWAEQSGDRNSANSCINGPTEIAACYIGIAEADESYFEIARDLYAKQRQVLFEPATGRVYDSVVMNPEDGSVAKRNTWASTYNQGTMLGAAVLLYQYYGDKQYKEDADRIYNYTKQELCDKHGIIKVCQNVDGDFQGFKGILMRYVGLYARVFDSDDARQWLIRNAFHAYNNMNSQQYGHSAWLTKAAEDGMFGDKAYTKSPFGASTSISAAFACPMPESEVTAIEDITFSNGSSNHTGKIASDNDCCYSLDGRKLSAPAKKKGLYIYRNKKYLAK